MNKTTQVVECYGCGEELLYGDAYDRNGQAWCSECLVHKGDRTIINERKQEYNRARLKVGERIESIAPIDRFGCFYIRDIGLSGKVVAVDEERVHIKLTKHFDVLDEWDNIIQVKLDHPLDWMYEFARLSSITKSKFVTIMCKK